MNLTMEMFLQKEMEYVIIFVLKDDTFIPLEKLYFHNTTLLLNTMEVSR